eukprot:CAMPEP_0182906198 /NCGR_PEP_ID=MMETSP0034_2-20130328/33553_1 /TAXON_ID=156128 /ORGANISM="Nephroselmis pyriformis, Strain CCMP717" /LENGTH=217 /DNA_ID=CAMNT_0025041817 /DNA_START=300 /DNA_END=949 /DNA_ORIENTATION=+
MAEGGYSLALVVIPPVVIGVLLLAALAYVWWLRWQLDQDDPQIPDLEDGSLPGTSTRSRQNSVGAESRRMSVLDENNGEVDVQSPIEKVVQFLEELEKAKSGKRKTKKTLNLAKQAGQLRDDLLAADNYNLPDLESKLAARMSGRGSEAGQQLSTVYNTDIINFVIGATSVAGKGAQRRKEILREVTKSTAFEVEHMKKQGRRTSAGLDRESETGGA